MAADGAGEFAMGINGPIPAENIGRALYHEHLLMDMNASGGGEYIKVPDDPIGARIFHEKVSLENLDYIRRHPYNNLDNCTITELPELINEVRYFVEAGGSTICSISPDLGVGHGRHVPFNRAIAEATGVNIISGSGWYISSFQPEAVRNGTEQQVTDLLLRQLVEGDSETGSRPGVIGELGSSLPVTEKKMLHAAANAQQETGYPIVVHIHPPGREGHRVLDALEEAGADLSRVALSHLDAALGHDTGEDNFETAIDYHLSLADRGAYLGYDLCGNEGPFTTAEHSWWLPTDRQRVKAIRRLSQRGVGDRILLAHDVGHKYYLRTWGGWGYAHVLTSFSDYMRDAGIDQQQIDQIQIDNNRRLLTIEGLTADA